MVLRCPLIGYARCDKECVFRKPGSDELEVQKYPEDGAILCRLVSLVDEMTNHYRKESSIIDAAHNQSR